MFDKSKIQKWIDVVESNAANKYDCVGIYSISIGNILVYIGKATDVKYRIACHLSNIMDEDASDYKAHKYEVLREAKRQGFPISFDLLYACQSTDQEDLIDELGRKEGELIRQYMPPLNYQIPKESNYKSFTVQRSAKTITLDQIMAQNY